MRDADIHDDRVNGQIHSNRPHIAVAATEAPSSPLAEQTAMIRHRGCPKPYFNHP